MKLNQTLIALSFFQEELVEFRQVFEGHNIILTVFMLTVFMICEQLNKFHSQNT